MKIKHLTVCLIAINLINILAFKIDAYANIGSESFEQQFRESMLRENPYLSPEDIQICGYYDSDGNAVTADEFAILIAQKALDGASEEYRATHKVDSEGRVVNTTTGQPDKVSGKDISVSSIASSQPLKEKVTAKFVNLYGVILETSKITKGTDIAKSQFPKDTPPDIITKNGIMIFDKWNYDGSILEDDIIVKAQYKKAKDNGER